MSDHTPGPWMFDKDNVGVNRASGYGILNSEGTIGVTVHLKHLGFVTPDELIENAEANARLIAAAPELLVALEDMVKNDYASKQPGHFQRTEKARAAIAKAKGESKSPVTS